jgi:hypothetical protein
VTFMADVLRGVVRASTRDRIEAGRWLGDRGWGKAAETVLSGSLSSDQQAIAAELTREQLLALAEAPTTREALPPADAAAA